MPDGFSALLVEAIFCGVPAFVIVEDVPAGDCALGVSGRVFSCAKVAAAVNAITQQTNKSNFRVLKRICTL